MWSGEQKELADHVGENKMQRDEKSADQKMPFEVYVAASSTAWRAFSPFSFVLLALFMYILRS